MFGIDGALHRTLGRYGRRPASEVISRFQRKQHRRGSYRHAGLSGAQRLAPGQSGGGLARPAVPQDQGTSRLARESASRFIAAGFRRGSRLPIAGSRDTGAAEGAHRDVAGVKRNFLFFRAPGGWAARWP